MGKEYPPGVERLLKAIRSSGDFPAMAHTVGVINSMTVSESTSAVALADMILHDYGLTQKLLRMVNTMGYTQYGEVTTVTRAVMLMGFERIRSIATSLILFEHFRKQARSGPLLELLNRSFCGAVVSRNIAQTTGYSDSEEAFVCGLYHRLGRVLTAFYLPAEYGQIDAAPPAERQAKTREVMGADFDAIGTIIAQELHLPDALKQSMVPMGEEVRRGTTVRGDRLACLASMSNEIVDAMTATGDVAARRAELEQVVATYGEQIKLPAGIDSLLDRVVSEVKASSSTFKLRTDGSAVIARIGQFGSSAPKNASADETGSGELLMSDEEEIDPASRATPETILTNGLHEVTSLLMGEYSFDDVLRVVLETIYRALGVGRTKVLFLLNDPSRTTAGFRFGFGHTDAESKLWASVPIMGTTDFISQAITLDKDIIVRNARIPSVAQALPTWLVKKGGVLDRYMILLPLTVDERSVGLFYIDGEKHTGALLTPHIINYLKLLRGQVVLAIKRRAKPKT